MAYRGENPNALPAHAEPDQAAQVLGGYDQRQQPAGRGGPRPQGNYPPLRSSSASYGAGASQSPHGQQQQQGGPHYGLASPPNAGGYGPPGPQQRPPPVSRPPPTPAPPPGADPTLWPLFKAVDKDGSGKLTEKELRAALVNGDWSSFDPHTVRMMIRMFDTDRDGTIGFQEFCGLWGFLAAWRSLFDRFDTDGSGNISYDEFTNALSAFGYRLSPQFIQLLFRSYDRRGTEPVVSQTTGQNAISFDLFVQCCISLKRMTEVFKKYDDDRDGYITLSFEEFLTEILRQR
ncbi:EF-hand [Ascobolus immersus RN42]|uniref:EF-hand n=1 Tax=Ascobolus immersus RN42 TaxID=1160509 RepID=A0A3N4IS52_ASCIM|nr:EF-hand [Ascobolus immersus RN42]